MTLPRIPLWINRLTSSGAVLWDRALWTQRVVDKVKPPKKASLAESTPEAESGTIASVAEAGRSQPRSLPPIQTLPPMPHSSDEERELPPLPPPFPS
jgi:hypothetical protein